MRNRSGVLQDNTTKNNAVLDVLSKRGRIKPVDGGRTIVEEMDYNENATFMWYSGYDQLNVSPSDVITAAEFNYAQAAVAVSLSGLEELQNSGKSQIIDLLEGRIENAMRTKRLAYIRISARAIRFRRSDLEAFIVRHRINSVAD